MSNDYVPSDDENFIDEEMEEIRNNSIEKDTNVNNSSKKSQVLKTGQKQKRRSKNESYGRDYVCGCGKNYLSYPALYTHIKTKHDGKIPEGTRANQVQNNKGRGRPRKNLLLSDEFNKKQYKDKNINNTDFQNNLIKDMISKSFKNNCNEHYISEGEKYFNKIFSFFSLFNSQNNHNNSNNNSVLESLGGNKQNYNGNNKLSINEGNNLSEKDDFLSIFKEFLPSSNEKKEQNSKENAYEKLHLLTKKMFENEKTYVDCYENKEKITSDLAIVLFLVYLSEVLNLKKDYVILNLVLLKNFRDLTNIISPSIFLSKSSSESSKTHSPNNLPLLSERFLNSYVPIKMSNFDPYFAAVITAHFLFWLYINDLTYIKVDLVNIKNETETKRKVSLSISAKSEKAEEEKNKESKQSNTEEDKGNDCGNEEIEMEDFGNVEEM